MGEQAVPEIHWNASARSDSKPIVKMGLWSIGIVMVVFLIWGSTFKLDSAIITPGTVTSLGKNQLVQHSLGGQISELHVKEGDRVEAGQPIVSLEPQQAKAEQAKLDARHASLTALRDRLDAERSGGSRAMREPSRKLVFPALRGVSSQPAAVQVSLRGGDGETIALDALEKTALAAPENTKPAPPTDEPELYQSQREAYDSGRALLSKEVAALEKKADTLRKQREGLKARIGAQNALLDMTSNELARLQPLADRGYVARNRIDEKRRVVLELEGAIAALNLDIGGIENQLGEVALQIDKARIANSDVAAREYARIVAEIAEIEEQRTAARDAVRGLVVRAPVSGYLAELQVNTVGGVFSGGDVIGAIVPEGAPLVVEARVAPSDIDYVNIGQKADVAITAFNRRLDDSLTGIVEFVSPDSQKDENTGEQYFTVRLRFAEEEGGNDRREDIQPGMQTEVYIHTGSRTFLTYLSKPLLDSFRRAFREQ